MTFPEDEKYTGGRGVLGLIFVGYVSPYSIIVYS